MQKILPKLAIGLGFLGLIAIFFGLGLDEQLTLDNLKARQNEFQAYYAEHRTLTLLTYFIGYILLTGVSLPGAAIVTLAGGALFGFWTALIVVSFASTLGATLAFLLARYFFRSAIQTRFADRLEPIQRGFEENGAFYLLSLRLVPVVPFFVINLVFSLTPIRTWTFYWVSQVGMLAGTAVYINAGTQLGRIRSLSEIFSPAIFWSFVLLGLFPLVVKWLLNRYQSRRKKIGGSL